MEKKTKFIPQFRVPEDHKKSIQEMADKKNRPMTQIMQIIVAKVANEYKNGTWKESEY